MATLGRSPFAPRHLTVTYAFWGGHSLKKKPKRRSRPAIFAADPHCGAPHRTPRVLLRPPSRLADAPVLPQPPVLPQHGRHSAVAVVRRHAAMDRLARAGRRPCAARRRVARLVPWRAAPPVGGRGVGARRQQRRLSSSRLGHLASPQLGARRQQRVRRRAHVAVHGCNVQRRGA